MRDKGQVSVEYLLVTAFAFLFAIPTLVIFYSQSFQLEEDISSSQADKIASEIVNAANDVYFLGKPSKRTITVYMPKNVKSINIQGRSISITLGSRAGNYEVVKWSSANLTGTIDSFTGLHNIEVEARLQDVMITG